MKDKVVYIGRRILNNGKIGFCYLFENREIVFSKLRSKKTAIGSIIEIEDADCDTWGIGNVIGITDNSLAISEWIAQDKSIEIEHKKRNIFKRIPENKYSDSLRHLKHLKNKLHPRDRNNFCMSIYLELLKY